MRIILILFLLVCILSPVAAHATFARIEPRAVDPASWDSCVFAEPASPGPRQIAVVLRFSSENLWGLRFAIKQSDINWQLLDISSPFIKVGGATDLAIGFGSCIAAPVVAATITYFSFNHSPCGDIDLTAAPGFADVVATTCNFTDTAIQGGALTINGVYDTSPGAEDPSCFCPPVATQPSTWGKVKALYRN